VKWRRLCIDVAEDGRLLNGSIEEYASIGGTGGFDQVTVIAPSFRWERPMDHFRTLLAEPWSEPALPFPEKGWVVDGPAPSLTAWRSTYRPDFIDVPLLSGDEPELADDTF
jgi:hypothetical protein